MAKQKPKGDSPRREIARPNGSPDLCFTLGILPAALSLIVVTFIAYQPVWHAGFIWDDQQNITDNQVLRTADGLQKTWIDPSASIQYYPLTYTGFWIEYHLWGLQPLGYH